MDGDAVADLIEAELPDAEATVTTPRDPDDDLPSNAGETTSTA